MSTQDSEEVDPHANADATQGHDVSPWKVSHPPTDAPIGAGENDLWNWRTMVQAGAQGDAAQADQIKHMGNTKWPGNELKRGIDQDKSLWTPTDTPVGADDESYVRGWPTKITGPASSSTGSGSHKPFRGRYVVVLASALLLLLLGGGALYVEGPWAVGACPSGMRGSSIATRVAASALEPCGVGQTDSSGTKPLVSATNTGAPATAPSTATAPTQPSATVAPRPTAKPTVQPTATATPLPRPTVSILAPANNSTATNTNGESPTSDPITFHASATPGPGASSVTITWLDSVDGSLGTGATLVHPLSSRHPTNCGAPTAHVVTAKAQNNLGGVTSTSITVSVVPNCLA
jgi:hypothetical protein